MVMSKTFKLLAVFSCVSVFGVLMKWAMFPALLKSQLKKEMALSKKTDTRKNWATFPFALDYKIYVFNYTNVDEIAKGAIPIVKEIGPYYFEEWREKVELTDNEENDTVSYRKKDTFYFKPELSGPGLTGEEIVTIPHVFVLAMAITVNRTRPAMLNMVGKAINGVFDNPPDVFLRAKVMDIFFRGIMIDCAKTELAPRTACAAIKKAQIKGMLYEPNNQFRFSIFGARNSTIDSQVVTVMRGMRNVNDVGKVVAVDGKPELNMWRDHCNQFGGTDSTAFPPFVKETERLGCFIGDVCRGFKPWFIKKTSYSGIKTNRYYTDFGDFGNDPELQCFCKTPETCPPKGLMDLTSCFSAPMYASLPHYLDSDPKLLQDVKGLSPNFEEHSIYFDFEPISGTPMKVFLRIQFNIELFQTKKVDMFKSLPGTMAPIFWIEEGLALNKTFVKMLNHQLFLPKKVVSVLSWMMILGGIMASVLTLLYYNKDRLMQATKNDNKNTKVTPEENGEKGISIVGAQEPAKINI